MKLRADFGQIEDYFQAAVPLTSSHDAQSTETPPKELSVPSTDIMRRLQITVTDLELMKERHKQLGFLRAHRNRASAINKVRPGDACRLSSIHMYLDLLMSNFTRSGAHDKMAASVEVGRKLWADEITDPGRNIRSWAGD